MSAQLNEMLARERVADISRAAAPQGARRNSLRILLDARRARRRSPVG